MTPNSMPGTLAAFACGAVVALVVIASRQDVIAAKSGTVHTCAAADGTLRLTGEAVPCVPGERRVRIQVSVPEEKDCEEDNDRMQQLERRLKDLEYRDRMGTLRGRRVYAPFEVVTKKGTRLMRIEEQNVTFYNQGARPVVWIETDSSGGLLQTQTAAGDREATIAAQGNRSHLVIKEKGEDRVDVGRRANGYYNLQVYGPANKMVAGIGQSSAGSGLMLVGDAAGATKVKMSFDATRLGTLMSVANRAGLEVGTISAAFGGGILQLTDAAGRSMVEAGLTEANVGVVRTLPGTCHFGIGILGLVPNCIVGKR
jgi:hypothetical protein